MFKRESATQGVYISILRQQKSLVYAYYKSSGQDKDTHLGVLQSPGLSFDAILKNLGFHSSTDKVHAAIVLPAEVCQISIINKPDVPDNQLKKSLKFYASGILNLPIESAVVDGFRVPAKYGSADKVFLVSGEKVKIKKYIERNSGIERNLESINVHEVSFKDGMKNLVDTENGIMVIYESEQELYGSFIKKGELYLTRKLNGCSTLGEINSKRFILECKTLSKIYNIQMKQDAFETIYLCNSIYQNIILREEISKEFQIPVKEVNTEIFKEHNAVFDNEYFEESICVYGSLCSLVDELS